MAPDSHGRPNHARAHNYLLGGESHWIVDRDFVHTALEVYPALRMVAEATRQFVYSAVRRFAGLGIRQFLDVGSGVPTAGGIHRFADNLAGTCDGDQDFRVVYVDNDPLATVYTQHVLDREGDEERHAVVTADLRRPDELWAEVLDADVIDPDQPVGLILASTLNIEQPGPHGEDIGPDSVKRLSALLPGRSCVALSHIVTTGVPDDVRNRLLDLREVYHAHGLSVNWRTRGQVEEILGGFELLVPGWNWVTLHDRTEHGQDDLNRRLRPFASPEHSAVWAGFARV